MGPGLGCPIWYYGIYSGHTEYYVIQYIIYSGLGIKERERDSDALTVSDLKYSIPLNWSTVHHRLFHPVRSLPVLNRYPFLLTICGTTV